MFKKLLIANRGEICCRIIKTARKMGIRTVAVYSDADADAMHVQMADEAVHIGSSAAKDSYLKAQTIINVCKDLGVDAVHPGYGFLSENAHFAELCAQNNIVFVGPPTSAIEAMGSKSAAKSIMEKAGVPLVPGYHGEDQSVELIKQAADDMGYPVLLKAAAGGGGKGMRQVWFEAEFDDALAAAKREALSSFGDDTMLVEKYLTQPRHVEIQVFCDSHGNGVYLFERDCSLQRRHQKVIEEAPAPGLSEDIRTAMGEAALKAAKAINYEGAGTVEFLYDIDGSFYFMEMNTRLQVEHPVTEMITEQDLVEWQLKVAFGETLPLKQDQLKVKGHAFEARVYAEDPDNDFLPVTGKLSFLQPPLENNNVRVDTGVRQGDEVSVFYDPMIAKLIVWDEDRDKALNRLLLALSEYRINGMTTNLPFLYNLVNTEAFRNVDIDTGFIEKNKEQIFVNSEYDVNRAMPLMVLAILLNKQRLNKQRLNKQQQTGASSSDHSSPWQFANAWRANEQHSQQVSVAFGGEIHSCEIFHGKSNHQDAMNASQFSISLDGEEMTVAGELEDDVLTANVNGHRQKATLVTHGSDMSLYTVHKALHFSEHTPDLGLHEDADDSNSFTAPMNGTVVKLLVTTGELVEADKPLMIMEAMKMEHTIKSSAKGKVTEFFFQEGELVDGGAELLAFEADAV